MVTVLCSFGFELDCRHDTELLHQAEGVPLLPLLNDLSARDSMNGYASDGNALAGRSNAQEIASMSSSKLPSGDNVNIVRELVFHASFGIGKGRAYRVEELL